MTGIVHNFLFPDLYSPQCLNKHLAGFENTWTLELSVSILEKWTTAVLDIVESHLPGILVYLSLNKEVLCQHFRLTSWWPLVFALLILLSSAEPYGQGAFSPTLSFPALSDWCTHFCSCQGCFPRLPHLGSSDRGWLAAARHARASFFLSFHFIDTLNSFSGHSEPCFL